MESNWFWDHRTNTSDFTFSLNIFLLNHDLFYSTMVNSLNSLYEGFNFIFYAWFLFYFFREKNNNLASGMSRLNKRSLVLSLTTGEYYSISWNHETLNLLNFMKTTHQVFLFQKRAMCFCSLVFCNKITRYVQTLLL